MSGWYFYFTAHILGLVFMYFWGDSIEQQHPDFRKSFNKKNLKVPFIPIFKSLFFFFLIPDSSGVESYH